MAVTVTAAATGVMAAATTAAAAMVVVIVSTIAGIIVAGAAARCSNVASRNVVMNAAMAALPKVNRNRTPTTAWARRRTTLLLRLREMTTGPLLRALVLARTPLLPELRLPGEVP